MTRFLTLATIFLALLVPSTLFAQTSCSAGIPVTMQLTSELSSTVPSASIGIYAVMQNTSEEEISNASLAVDVRSQAGAIVDRFIVPQTVTIFAQNSAKIGFIWKVPPAIEDGTYTVTATLAPADATRAAVFTHAFYPSASIDISIKDGAPVGIRIRSLAVNAQPYEERTVAPFSQGRLSATADAGNQGAGPYKGSVTWRTYAAGATLSDAPINERTDVVELHPGKSESVSYDLPSGADAYYIEGEFHDGGTVYFDMLLDRGTNAFPWASCRPASPRNRSGSGTLFFVAIAIAIAFIAIVTFAVIEYRRIHS